MEEEESELEEPQEVGRGGRKGRASKTFVVPHPRLAGVLVAKGQQQAIVTKNIVPGESVYNEKKISVEDKQTGEKVKYKVWNPFRSKIAAVIIGGVSDVVIKPCAKVLYFGAASGTTVSHVQVIIGSEGRFIMMSFWCGFAVELYRRSGRDLVYMAKKRANIVPITADARKPLINDACRNDVAQPDQARILGLNSQYFLKKGGNFMISINANCIDSKNRAEVVFQHKEQRLKVEGITPQEQLTLEFYERDHAIVIQFRSIKLFNQS